MFFLTLGRYPNLLHSWLHNHGWEDGSSWTCKFFSFLLIPVLLALRYNWDCALRWYVFAQDRFSLHTLYLSVCEKHTRRFSGLILSRLVSVFNPSSEWDMKTFKTKRYLNLNFLNRAVAHTAYINDHWKIFNSFWNVCLKSQCGLGVISSNLQL